MPTFTANHASTESARNLVHRGVSIMNASGHSRSVVLCIDDQATGLELRKLVLQKTGYRVLTATNARQALKIFRENAVDVVLMEDVVGNTGSSVLLPQMKALKPEVPVAIYSADRAESLEGLRFADMFITKLASIDELLRAIRRLLKVESSKAA